MKVARRLNGFTMVEALASVILVGVGVTAALGGISAISQAESNARDRERLEMLAMQKFDELLATGATTSAESGDFNDRGRSDVTWSSQVTPSGVDNLNHISVTVQMSNVSNGPVAEFDTLLYVPSTTTSSTGTTQ